MYDYLIIGQGISGSWLSYFLQKEGKSVLVIDKQTEFASSSIAAGVINPVTGRRHVTAWLAEQVMHFAWESYSKAGQELDIVAISHKNIIDFFPSPQMLDSFRQRVLEENKYVHSYPEQNQFNPYFNYVFGCGEIRPVYIAHLETFLPAWRKRLIESDSLLEEEFDLRLLELKSDSVSYKGLTASTIIFCDGQSSASNPWFDLLPFAPNKGELMILEIEDLPAQHIYKQGMMLVPLAAENQWWIGSSYAWKFNNDLPTEDFKNKTESFLKYWLKIPFKILSHKAGIRPATLERRPFVGRHPSQKNIAILNGMGTKGCSLAPYFAKQLADNLIYDLPIHAEADVNRFRRVLSKKY